MSFAQEIRDFSAAFTAVSGVLGNRRSREAERLDNEYRRATIDYTRARTAEIAGQGMDVDDYLSGLNYDPSPIDATPGGAAETGATTDVATKSDFLRSSWLTQTGLGVPARTGAGAGVVVPKPTISPARTATGVVPTPRSKPAKTAAVDDSDLGGGTGADVALGGPRADRIAAAPDFDVRISDRTSMRGVQPRTIGALQRGNAVAKQMGIRLVVTAGAGGGHLSHGSGSEVDFIGYRSDGSKWSNEERARILAATGFNRIGLYPGMSAHGGFAGEGRPSAMWGAGGRVRGPSSRQFTNPADRALLAAFNSGKLFGGTGGTGLTFRDVGENPIGFDEDPLVRARNAIASIESVGSGGYSAVNRKSGALGRYQVMPQYLSQWSKGALGRAVSREEFLANPQIQDAVFDYHFGNLFEKYGNLQDAASAWFTGRPLGAGGAAATDQNLTGAQYVAKFNRAYGAGETGYTGGGPTSGPAAGAPAVDPFAKDDEIMGAYPEAAARTAPPEEARTKDDTIADTGTGPTAPGGGMAPVADKVHTVEEGDTLWDLAKKYNLETYMALVEANPDVIEDPDLIYPGERLKVPGVGGEEADVPLPKPRPGTREARTKDDELTLESEGGPPNPRLRPAKMTSSTTDSMLVEPNPMESSSGDVMRPGVTGRPALEVTESYTPYDYTGGPFRGRPGQVAPNIIQQSVPDLKAELSRAYDQITVVSKSDMEPNAKAKLLTAITVKIETLKNEIGSRGGKDDGSALMGPATIGKKASDYRSELLERRPEDADMLTEGYYKGLQRSDALRLGDAEEPISSSEPDALNAAGMTPPTPERGPVDRTQLTGSESSDVELGGRAVDELSPARASIAAVTNSWNMTDDGHIMTPEGQKSTRDTFKAGRDAAREGSSWLAEMFFPGGDNDAVDLAEDETPDDGSDTMADRYLSGAYAVKKSDMQKVHDVVDAWAQRHGVELTESERNMRSLGIMFDYWLTRGEPEKARAVAGGMLQYYRVRYGQYSAISQAALANGDTEKAVEAAVKAYAQIPDGRDIQVEGDAENGWTFSYINEETGKRISQKVMSPQEVQGMILGMSPDDVDKFLVKAAGEDELPEPSPAFSAAIDALNATPPGEKPVYDAKAMAYFDSGEASIYGQAFSQKMEEWQQGAALRDYELYAGAPPPEAVAGTPPATGGAGTVTGPGAGAGVPTTPPAAGGGGAAVPGIGEAPLPGGATQIAPRVWTPGADGTYGLGDFEQMQMRPAETTFGIELQKLNFENRKDAYERELTRRDQSYQRWVYAHEMLAPPLPEENPMQSSTTDVMEPDTTQYGPPSEAAIPGAAAFGERASRLAAASLPTVKGPAANWGLTKRPEVDENILTVLKDDALRTAYEAKVEKRAAAWDAARDVIKAKYEQQTAVPEPAKWSVEEEQQVESAFTNFPEGFDLTEQEIADGLDEQLATYVKDNKEGLTQLAIRIGQQNEGMTPQSAATAVLGLTVPDPGRLGVPPFVAVPHPEQANLFIVQPLDVDDSMDGVPLLMRKAEVDLVLDYWQNERMRMVTAQNTANPIPPAGTTRNLYPPGAGLESGRVPRTPLPGTPGIPPPSTGALDIGDVPPGLPVQGPQISNPQPPAANDPNRVPGNNYTFEQLEQLNNDPAIVEWARRRELEKNLSQPFVNPGALDLEREINPWETWPVLNGR